MELVFGLIGFVLLFWLLGAGFRTVGAAAKTAFGKGTFSENMELEFKGMGPLEIRFSDKRVGETGSKFLAKEIEAKGVFPVNRTVQVGFITSVFDKTSGTLEPVISAIEGFQEPDNVVYQHSVEVGSLSLGQGLPYWVRLGVVLPGILQPPVGGERRLIAVLRMVDMDNLPVINHGFAQQDQSGLLWTSALEFDYIFDEKGYQETVENRDESMALALKVAMAVAMADGSLNELEGQILKTWVIRAIEPFNEQKREYLKGLYNDAMRDAYHAARDGSLSLSELTHRLNDIGEKRTKYEAIELCFDVMAADRVADPEEMKTIRQVAESLDLDLEEIERIRDQKIVNLDTSVSAQASVEDLLGIEGDWTRERIRKHLGIEFQKWNNRLNTLAEGTERDNAQRMLDLIAEARRKHD